jgi:hypothetical protein
MSDNVIKLVPLRDLPEDSRLVVRCAADIKPEKIDWLWEERLPLGKSVLVAGEGGLGKSMLLAWPLLAGARIGPAVKDRQDEVPSSFCRPRTMRPTPSSLG